MNFSLSALIHNKEELSVNCDWNGPADVGRIKSIQQDFDRSFNGLDPDIEFVKAVDLHGYTLSRDKAKSLDELLNDELDLVIKKSIDRLKEPFKMAIVMREIQGLSYDEIARATNSSIGTVKSRIARARCKLQEYIKPYIC